MNQEGDTPLHTVAKECLEEVLNVVQLLLNKGADPVARNRVGGNRQLRNSLVQGGCKTVMEGYTTSFNVSCPFDGN